MFRGTFSKSFSFPILLMEYCGNVSNHLRIWTEKLFNLYLLQTGPMRVYYYHYYYYYCYYYYFIETFRGYC